MLCRERDELLALLDVKERGRYLRSRSISEDEAYSEYSSTEVKTGFYFKSKLICHAILLFAIGLQ